MTLGSDILMMTLRSDSLVGALTCGNIPSVAETYGTLELSRECDAGNISRTLSGQMIMLAGPARSGRDLPNTTRPEIINGGGCKGCEVEPGTGEEAAEEAGPGLHPFEPAL